MPYMTRLLPDLKRYFPRVDTIPGWETRGNSSFAPAGVVGHWTAGPRGAAADKRPSLNVVVNGRPDLSGPLCNVYLDRAGVPVIVAAGRANHAGPGGYKGLVGNSAVYGIEAESAGDGDWTAAQKAAYPRLVRAMLDGLGRGSEFFCGHNVWAPTRKIDIRDWPMDAFRASVAAATPLEDDMPLTNDDLTRLADAVEARLRRAQWGSETDTVEGLLHRAALAGDVAVGYGQRVEHTEAMVAGISAEGIAARLAPVLQAALKGATVTGASADEVAKKVADLLAARLAS